MEVINKNKTCNVFQVDSEIVQAVYNNQPNYLIEYDNTYKDEQTCAIYMCSNDIYYPNDESVFRRRIVEKNFFEWYNCRVKAYKHIFVRDIFKQWYLAGINKDINTIEKLAAFLQAECNGYKVTMIGSSAGGYASILLGSILNSDKVLAFNPQFEIGSLLNNSTESINPLIFRLKDNEAQRYFDITPLINKGVNIYYFYSSKSPWDMQQQVKSKGISNIHTIVLNTKHHGIPFLKVALRDVINFDAARLNKLARIKHNPLLFTISVVGICRTIEGLWSQVISKYERKRS